MDSFSIMGYVATALGGYSYIPQLWKWARGAVRDGESVAPLYLALHLTANVLWILYSVHFETWPYLVTAALSLGVDATWLHIKARDVCIQRRQARSIAPQALLPVSAPLQAPPPPPPP